MQNLDKVDFTRTKVNFSEPDGFRTYAEIISGPKDHELENLGRLLLHLQKLAANPEGLLELNNYIEDALGTMFPMTTRSDHARAAWIESFAGGEVNGN